MNPKYQPSKEKSSRELHAFDLDRTLLRSTISYEYGSFLYKNGFMSTFKMLNLCRIYFLHKCGYLDISQTHHRAFASLFQGKLAHQFEETLPKFFQTLYPQELYGPAWSKLQALHERGEVTALLSSSPSFLVVPFAKKLGFTHIESTHYQVDKENQFSHVGNIITGAVKKTLLQELIQRLNIDQKNVYAYSDSILDLPFLQEAAHPVVVNADRSLKALANKKGWQTI